MDDDDDECEVDDRNDGPLNWAAAVWSLLVIPYCVARGFELALDNLLGGLGNTSRAIDRRKRFAAEAGMAIESMTRDDT